MKKISVIILSVLLLVACLPLSAFASEADASPTCADISREKIKIDGMDTEGWENINYSLLDTVFQNVASPATEKQSRVRLATDGQNLYLYYQTTGEHLGESPLLYVYLKTPGMDATCHSVVYIKNADKDFFRNQLGAQKAVTVSGGIYTVEMSIPLGDSERLKLRTEDITNAWIGILERYETTGGGMVLSSSFGWGADSLFTIPQIDPIVDLTENPTVKSVAGKDVTVDGRKNESEGWATVPYMILDAPMWGADSAGATEDAGVWFSADEESLYVFLESTGERYGEQPLFYLNLLFADFTKPLECGIELKAGNTAFWRFRCNDETQESYLSDAKTRAKVSVTYTGGKVCAELSIPLPDAERAAVKTGEATVKIGVFERFNARSGDAGMAPSDGFGWGTNIIMVLPAINTVAIVTDVEGRKITVNGAMGSAEGWATMPYAVLGYITSDGATSTGRVSDEPSSVRYSVDSENIYVFFETGKMTSERLYLQFAFNGMRYGEGARGEFLNMELDIKPNAAEPIIAMSFSESGIYSVGDPIYDGAQAATKEMSSKICIEVAVPIPESVAEKRLEGAVTVAVGVYERFSLESKDGYIADIVYNEASPTLTLLLEKDEATVAENLLKWIEAGRADADHEYLKKISVNLFGDSYFTGGGLSPEYTWSSILATKYGWILNNYAEADDMMSSYGGLDELPMSKRYRQLPNNAPDLIIVTGGYYDWKNNVPIGQLGSRDTDTFYGALEATVEGIKSKYQESIIIFVTSWSFVGENDLSLTYKDYAEAMVAVCEQKGVYCYKGHESAVSNIDMQSAAFRDAYCLSENDTYHLNLEGMKLATGSVEAFLNESAVDWWSKYAPDGDADNITSPEPDRADGDDGETELNSESEENTDLDSEEPIITVSVIVAISIAVAVSVAAVVLAVVILRKKPVSHTKKIIGPSDPSDDPKMKNKQ